ncbi:MAG: ATP-binding protein [Patescibacteria group bacterium]
MKKATDGTQSTATATVATQGDEIQADIGPGFLRKVFGGKSFIHCVIEMVKNSRDWGAQNIAIADEIRQAWRIADDGDGMGRANRNAFFSIHMTTANSPKQSGRFCTGTKQLLFSFAKRVSVLTAPKEEPDVVYRFSFTAEEYERIVLSKGRRPVEKMKKTAETWPFPHPFGTEITYELEDPGSRSILRGETLAKELAARLPCIFHDIVHVDGELIPPKEIIGEMFELTVKHPYLGEVSVELYQPKRKSRDEGLRLTAVEIGEITMRNLYRVLGELQDSFPLLYLKDEVCGMISAEYVRHYVNEDRDSVSPRIADDELTVYLLRFLKEIAPQVQKNLQLKMVATSPKEALDASVDELLILFDDCYNKDRRRPPAPPPPGPPPPPPPGPPSEQRPLVLHLDGYEYELGERVNVEARFREDLAAQHAPGDIQWLKTFSRGKDFRQTPKGISFAVSQVGEGTIRADLPGKPYGASATYQVVEKRRFRLSRFQHVIIVGTSFTLEGLNLDKLKGDIRWSLEGVGTLEEKGARATFTSDRIGCAVIHACDSRNPSVESMCEVTIMDEPEKLIPIRGEFFQPRYDNIAGNSGFDRPTLMIQGSRVHTLMFNTNGLGYREAAEKGNATLFLAQAIGMEYARFSRFDLKRGEISQDPRDTQALVEEILADGLKIFEEVLKNDRQRNLK